jgi:hypothetical protein
MKKLSFLVIFILSITSIIVLANNNIIENFKATPSGDVINIEWRTIAEANVKHFEIERSNSNSNIFKSIGIESAKGKAANYNFRDSDSFRKEMSEDSFQAETMISYRLKIVYNSPVNGSNYSYTEEIIVPQGNTGIKRTLGMIKEMFK